MRNDSGLQPEEPPRGRRLALFAAIAFFVVAANALGYVVYRAQRRPAVEVGATPPAAGAAPTAAPAAPVTPAPSPSEDPVKQLAREQRDRGIQALRNGTYGEARTALEAAAKLDPSLTEVTTLLELVEKLSAKTADGDRASERVAERASERERAPERTSERDRSSDRDRASDRERSAARASRSEPAAAPGVLLVTTTPPRLLVKIDGQGVELSPARLELTPGRHLVEIVQGGRVVLERSVELASGQSAVISETFAEPQADTRAVVAAPVAPPPRVSPPPAARTSGLEDERLDLVGLVDRAPTDRAAKAPVASPSPSSAPVAAAVAPAGGPARTANPSLYVVGGAGLEATLEANMRGVDVQMFGSSSELRAAMARQAPDGVLGPSAVVKGLGLQPAVLGMGPKVSWVAATLKAGLTRSELAGLTVGVVEDASKKVVEDRVGELVGGKPRVRRVPKTDDLLPLLQLKMADAVVVREADLAELRARTQQTVHVVPLGGVDTTRALAFTEGSRRSVVERAVLGLGADIRAQLGVEKWSKE